MLMASRLYKLGVTQPCTCYVQQCYYTVIVCIVLVSQERLHAVKAGIGLSLAGSRM